MTKRKTYFVLSKNVSKNLKHEIDTAIKNIEFLTKYTIKNVISRLLLKYNKGKEVHEHGNKLNEWTTQICLQLVTKFRLQNLN